MSEPCCVPARHVCFVYPGGERRIVEGVWHLHAFKIGETKITDEDTGARYMVAAVDDDLQTITLGRLRTVVVFAGEKVELTYGGEKAEQEPPVATA